MSAKINRQTSLVKGRVFSLIRENITLENGTVIDLDVIRHPGAAAIVAESAKGVVLIRQYRHAVGGYIWEIPAGTLGPDEPPLVCAKRELTEETGFQAAEWTAMGHIVPVPGYSDESIHLFLAAALTPARQQLDPDEILEVHEIPWPEVWPMIETGQIVDAKSICGLTMAFRRLF